MGTCWAPLYISDFIEEVPRHPEIPFESRLIKNRRIVSTAVAMVSGFLPVFLGLILEILFSDCICFFGRHYSSVQLSDDWSWLDLAWL